MAGNRDPSVVDGGNRYRNAIVVPEHCGAADGAASTSLAAVVEFGKG